MSTDRDYRELQTDDVIRYLRDRRNWGRWGSCDELGTLNLITKEKRREAATLARSGRLVSLSRPLPITPGPGNPHPVQHFMQRFTRPHSGGGAADYLGVFCHGLSTTHLDALCHVWGEEGMWNGRDPDEVITYDGGQYAHIDCWRDGIVTRGVLLDVPAYRKQPFVGLDAPVHGDELEDIAIHEGISIEPGDAVVVYCGRDAWERDHGTWGGDADGASLPTGAEHRPGLHASCLRFLREQDISVLVWDMMTATPSGFALPWTVDAAIWAFGLAIVDNAHLEPLAHACRDEQRYEFQLAIAPLRIEGGTGSPVNPLALL